jgi:hypothetical protein
VGWDASGQAYVVIDAGSDATLAERCARSEWLSPPEAADLVAAAARALDALHARGEVYDPAAPAAGRSDRRRPRLHRA